MTDAQYKARKKLDLPTKFEYIAAGSDKNKFTSTLFAIDETIARNQLADSDLTIISIRPILTEGQKELLKSLEKDTDIDYYIDLDLKQQLNLDQLIMQNYVTLKKIDVPKKLLLYKIGSKGDDYAKKGSW